MVAEEEPVVRTHLGEQFRGVLGVLRAAQDVRNAQQRRARVEHRDQPHAVRQVQPAVPHQPRRDRDVLQTTVVRGRARSRGFILDASLRIQPCRQYIAVVGYTLLSRHSTKTNVRHFNRGD